MSLSLPFRNQEKEKRRQEILTAAAEMEIDPGKFNPNGPSNEELDAFFKVVTNLLETPGVPEKLFGPEKTKAEKAERYKAAKFPNDLKMTFEDNSFDPKSSSNEELDMFFRDRKRNFSLVSRSTCERQVSTVTHRHHISPRKRDVAKIRSD